MRIGDGKFKIGIPPIVWVCVSNVVQISSLSVSTTVSSSSTVIIIHRLPSFSNMYFLRRIKVRCTGVSASHKPDPPAVYDQQVYRPSTVNDRVQARRRFVLVAGVLSWLLKCYALLPFQISSVEYFISKCYVRVLGKIL